MGVKLSKLMMRQYKDGVYRMSRVTVAKHVAQLEADLDGCVMGGNILYGALSSTQDKVERLEAENAALKRENGWLAEYRDSIEGWMWKYHGTDRTSRCRICGGKYPVHDVFGCSLADALPEDLNP